MKYATREMEKIFKVIAIKTVFFLQNQDLMTLGLI